MNKEELKEWLKVRNYEISGYEFWGLVLEEKNKKKSPYKELIVKRYIKSNQSLK